MAWSSDYATVFPVRGQAFEFTGFIVDNTTAQPCAVGTLTLTICKDGGAAGAAAGVVESVTSGMTGAFRVNLTAADMTANVITWTVASNTSNAVTAKGEIKTITMTESGTRAPDQTVVRFEQFWRQLWARWFNRNTINRTSAAYSVYDDADSTALYTGTSADDGTTGTMGKLS